MPGEGPLTAPAADEHARAGSGVAAAVADGTTGVDGVARDAAADGSATLANAPLAEQGCTAAPTAPREGLRVRKKLETYRSIQAAARRLVAERGVSHVTIEEIADAANVSYRTFFNYFDSKEAAVFDAAELNAEARLAAALAARPPEEAPLEALRAGVLAMLTQQAPGLRELAELVRQYPALADRESAAFAPFYRAIVDWAAKRYDVDPAACMYPALLAGITQIITRLAVTYCEAQHGDEGIVILADQAFDIVAAGLTAPPTAAACPPASLPEVCPG